MFNLLKRIALIILFLTLSYNHQPFHSFAEQEIDIALIIPLEHQSMNEIIKGFKEKSEELLSNKKLNIKIFNALGNPQILHSIILQIKNNDRYNIVVTVGSTITQSALPSLKEKSLIGLAVSTFSEGDRLKLPNKNATFISDEIDPNLTINFIQQVIPGIKKITLIRSNDDRIFNTFQKLKKIAKTNNIELKEILANSIMELNTNIKGLDNDSEVVLILKDHTIVSAIPYLKKIIPYSIPIISSDEGSVVAGAELGIGVNEIDIGKKGAEILADIIIKGNKISEIKNSKLSNVKIFYNTNSKKFTKEFLKNISDQMKLHLVTIDSNKDTIL